MKGLKSYVFKPVFYNITVETPTRCVNKIKKGQISVADYLAKQKVYKKTDLVEFQPHVSNIDILTEISILKVVFSYFLVQKLWFLKKLLYLLDK
jgi:hypothetical protein